MHDLKDFGDKGEDVAANYLSGKGYKILRRNFIIWGGQIDIIALDPDTKEVVFVEVKTRSSEFWQGIDETLSTKQLRFIRRACKRFLFKTKRENASWRIDHVAILMILNIVKRIEHYTAM